MKTISSTQNLVPLIEDLSQNLSEIASILRGMPAVEAAEKTMMPEEQNQPKEKKKSPNPKSSASMQGSNLNRNTVGSSEDFSEKNKPAVTIEQVRAVLAEKSQAGLTSQVKDLLTRFGSVKLSGIDPARYPELIKAAKALQ